MDSLLNFVLLLVLVKVAIVGLSGLGRLFNAYVDRVGSQEKSPPEISNR